MTKRPIGISIIAFIYIFKGILTPILLLLGKSGLENPDTIDWIAEHVEWVTLLLMGFGLFWGKKWAWWLTTVLFSLVMIYSGYKLIHIYLLMSEFDLELRQTLKYFAKPFGIIFIQLMIFVYLFQSNVFTYFRFEKGSAMKKLAIIVAIILSVIGVFWIIAAFR